MIDIYHDIASSEQEYCYTHVFDRSDEGDPIMMCYEFLFSLSHFYFDTLRAFSDM